MRIKFERKLLKFDNGKEKSRDFFSFGNKFGEVDDGIKSQHPREWAAFLASFAAPKSEEAPVVAEKPKKPKKGE